MVRLFVTRHAEREDHINTLWQNSSHRPHDSPLSMDGRQQPKECAEYLETKFDVGKVHLLVLTSPLIRCVGTARRLCEALGVANVELKVEEGLTEDNRNLRPRMMGTHRESNPTNPLSNLQRGLVEPVLLGPGDLVETASPVGIDLGYEPLHRIAYDKTGAELDFKTKQPMTCEDRVKAFIPPLLKYLDDEERKRRANTQKDTEELVCLLVTHGAFGKQLVSQLSGVDPSKIPGFDYLTTLELGKSDDGKWEYLSKWLLAKYRDGSGKAGNLA